MYNENGDNMKINKPRIKYLDEVRLTSLDGEDLRDALILEKDDEVELVDVNIDSVEF